MQQIPKIHNRTHTTRNKQKKIQGCINKFEMQLHACLQGLLFFSKLFSILHEIFARFPPLIILPSLDLCWTHLITYSLSSPYFSVSPSFNSHPILFYSPYLSIYPSLAHYLIIFYGMFLLPNIQLILQKNNHIPHFSLLMLPPFSPINKLFPLWNSFCQRVNVIQIRFFFIHASPLIFTMIFHSRLTL